MNKENFKIYLQSGVISLLLFFLVGCTSQNPFGSEKYTFEGTVTLKLGEGYDFSTSGKALSDGDGDIYFYGRGSKFLIGCGWETGGLGDPGYPDAPTTDVLCDLALPESSFDTIRWASTDNGDYEGEKELLPSTWQSNAVYMVFTKESSYSLIGITSFITNEGSESVTFKYLYNPYSSKDNPDLYKTY